MLEIDDLVILGRAVPVLLKDNRRTICTAGYSEKFGLVRVYPTYYTDNLHQWDVVSIKAEIDKRDSRDESWERDRSTQFEVAGSISQDKKNKETLLQSICEDICTKDLNQEKVSLAVIKPEILNFEFIEPKNTDDKGVLAQTLLDFWENKIVEKISPVKVKSDFPNIPYIDFRCGSSCKVKNPHHQQVLEWGIYRWMENHPDNIDQVWDNLRLRNNDYYKYFLIGNLRDRRTTWLIISILRGKKNIDMKPSVKKKVRYRKNEILKDKQTKLDNFD